MENILLDTSTILNKGDVIYDYPKCNVILPIIVIDEIDNNKDRSGSVGDNARLFMNEYLKLRELGDCYTEGVTLENGGTFRIELNHIHHKVVEDSNLFQEMIPDLRITSVAVNLAKENPSDQYYLVTDDHGFISRADAVVEKLSVKNLSVVYYGFNQSKEIYSGKQTITIKNEMMQKLRNSYEINWDEFKNSILEQQREIIHPGEYLICVNEYNEKETITARYKVSYKNDIKKEYVKPIKKYDEMEAKGLTLTDGQQMVFDALMDTETTVVSIIGETGSGKTLTSVAAGWIQTHKEVYDEFLITRANRPMSKDLDIGALPGDIKEKLDPWLKPIYQNFEFLYNLGVERDKRKKIEDILNELNFVNIEPIALMRGQTLPYLFFLVDEAQNLTPHEAKSLVTRLGKFGKIVFTGDTRQIDTPYLSKLNNGIVYVSNSMKPSYISATIVLEEIVRSETAREANKYLN